MTVSDPHQQCDVNAYIVDCSLPVFPIESSLAVGGSNVGVNTRTVANSFVVHSFNPTGEVTEADALDPFFKELLDSGSACVWVQSFGHTDKCEYALSVAAHFHSIEDCEFIPVRTRVPI